MEILFDFWFMLLFFVSGREKRFCCPFLTDYSRTFFCRKMGKKRSKKEEMEGKVFISRQNRHFAL